MKNTNLRAVPYAQNVTRRNLLNDIAGEDIVSAKEYEKVVPEIISMVNGLKVSRWQKTIFKKYYGLGCKALSVNAIADLYGIAPQTVRSTLTRTTHYIRRYAPLQLPLIAKQVVEKDAQKGMVVAESEDSILSIDELPFAAREVLVKRGIRYISDLEGYSERKLLRLRGIGPVYAKAIIEAAALYGIAIS